MPFLVEEIKDKDETEKEGNENGGQNLSSCPAAGCCNGSFHHQVENALSRNQVSEKDAHFGRPVRRDRNDDIPV